MTRDHAVKRLRELIESGRFREGVRFTQLQEGDEEDDLAVLMQVGEEIEELEKMSESAMRLMGRAGAEAKALIDLGVPKELAKAPIKSALESIIVGSVLLGALAVLETQGEIKKGSVGEVLH